jgi:ABC-2 type transport system ATP-binding protein
MSKIVEFRGVTKRYRNGVLALNGLSFSVNRGEIFAILGQNGAGKSTIIKLMLNFIFPTGGVVEFNRDENRVGYIHEENIGNKKEKVWDFLYYLGRLMGFYSQAELREKIEQLLSDYNLASKKNAPVATLSKGMQQKLKWILCSLNDPDILILDEPTDGLDPVSKKRMRDWFLQMKEKGKTLIISSHLLFEIEKVCDRFLLLQKGEKISEASISDLRASETLEDYYLRMVEEKGREAENR